MMRPILVGAFCVEEEVTSSSSQDASALKPAVR